MFRNNLGNTLRQRPCPRLARQVLIWNFRDQTRRGGLKAALGRCNALEANLFCSSVASKTVMFLGLKLGGAAALRRRINAAAFSPRNPLPLCAARRQSPASY